MKELFLPFTIKGLQLKNRIVMPPLASFLIEADGSITDKTVEHYRRRAAGGPAMVIMEAHSVSEEGYVSVHQARIYEDRYIEGLYRIANVIRSEGAVPAIQIHHAGRQVPTRVIKRKPLAPSPIPCPTIKGDVEPLTIDGIHEMIRKFGEAADRVIQAGFELIEIHGAHGYLINQFLSRFSNIRDDEYGGSIDNRARFAREIVREVRKRVGPEFPVSFKISAQEFVPEGLTTEESIEILKLLVEDSIDIVQVSAGNDATPEWISQPMFMKKACLSDSAKQIKAALDIPVMSVGRINDPITANNIIKEKKADLVCMGRGLLADPELPKKVENGQLDDIRICIGCNKCMQSIFRNGRIECLVNPNLGREKEMEIHQTKNRKKVMVVGGGPGGLNVAWVAAQRGHEVTLYEQENSLGGQLIIGSISNFKKEMGSIIDFQKKQLEKNNVRCKLNTRVNLEKIKEVKPDVLILATGSIPIIPEVPGIDNQIVLTVPQIFNGVKPALKKIVVIGGGATGCEVALHLSEKGYPMSIVEQLPNIGPDIEAITRNVTLQIFKKNDVKVFTSHKLKKIVENGIFIIDDEDNENFMEAGGVVIAIGNKPDNNLYEQVKIQNLDIELYRIGDCLEPRSAKEAILEGARIGRSI
jgi:2,4-dienoyl-CoA reductase-like NADH-dependent reductase (Old Yellow Enzyme family)/NADPH-dependent 2,4-dienoyl-CoA reductase/sulfur reductase-like enzyme